MALKLEPKHAKFPQLYYEYKLYKYFHRNLKVEIDVGIPKIYHYGIEGKYNILIMDLLGESLEDLFQFCRQRFNLKTILMLGS